MNQKISHDFNDESLEAKARWFQTLSLAERMDLLCELTDLVLENNPHVAEVGRDCSLQAESQANGNTTQSLG